MKTKKTFRPVTVNNNKLNDLLNYNEQENMFHISANHMHLLLETFQENIQVGDAKSSFKTWFHRVEQLYSTMKDCRYSNLGDIDYVNGKEKVKDFVKMAQAEFELLECFTIEARKDEE